MRSQRCTFRAWEKPPTLRKPPDVVLVLALLAPTQPVLRVSRSFASASVIGGDVIAKLGIVGRVLRVPWKVLAGKLAFDQLRVFGQEQDAAFELDLSGTLLDLAVLNRSGHNNDFK